MQRIGVLGGTMDPVHLGHLHAAKCALNAGVDRVLLAPCLHPAHREKPAASAEQRMKMCRLAAQIDPRIEVSDIDLREGTCYAADTVRLLQQRYPGDGICWILGADKLPGLTQWHKAEELFSRCEFLVCPRPGYDAHLPVPGARITVLEGAETAVSSSAVIRELRGLSDAGEMLPRSVARYIAENGLYQPDWEPTLRKYGMKDKRLRHTLGVRQTAVELAWLHGERMQAAATAAMLHDIAKPLPLKDMLKLVKRYRLKLPEELLTGENLLHGPLAAAIAERELGVTDGAVLSAIACHTTGKAGMTRLDKVIFLADAIEPNRADYPGLAEMRQLAKTDLDAAVLLSMRRTQEYVLARGLRLCGQTEQAIQDLIKQKEEQS